MMEFQMTAVALKVQRWSDSVYTLKVQLTGIAEKLDVGYKNRREIKHDFKGFVLSSWYFRIGEGGGGAGRGEGSKVEMPNMYLNGEITKAVDKQIHFLVNEIYSWPP